MSDAKCGWCGTLHACPAPDDLGPTGACVHALKVERDALKAGLLDQLPRSPKTGGVYGIDGATVGALIDVLEERVAYASGVRDAAGNADLVADLVAALDERSTLRNLLALARSRADQNVVAADAYADAMALFERERKERQKVEKRLATGEGILREILNVKNDYLAVVAAYAWLDKPDVVG